MLQDRGRQKGKEDKLCSMFTADLRGSWVGAVIRQNTGDSMTLLFLLLVSTGNSLAVLAGEDLCGHRQVDVEDPKLSPAAAALPGGLSFFQVLAPFLHLSSGQQQLASAPQMGLGLSEFSGVLVWKAASPAASYCCI